MMKHYWNIKNNNAKILKYAEIYNNNHENYWSIKINWKISKYTKIMIKNTDI